MNYIGIKPTHDGAIACIDDSGRLRFSYELEKNANNERHAKYRSTSQMLGHIEHVAENYLDGDPFMLSIDGWESSPKAMRNLQLAPYHEHHSKHVTHPLHAVAHDVPEWCEDGAPQGLDTLETGAHYLSFTHVTNHIMSGYCFSPWAGEQCNVLVFDGSTTPRLYLVDLKAGYCKYLGSAHLLNGMIYNRIAYYFGPFKKLEVAEAEQNPAIWYVERDVPMIMAAPGKLMGYAGTGKYNYEVATVLDTVYNRLLVPLFNHTNHGGRKNGEGGFAPDGLIEYEFLRGVYALVKMLEEQPTDADVIATFQQWMAGKLVAGMYNIVHRDKPVIMVGGCALNITANSLVRSQYPQVFVPPWANDSGSAIGAAASLYYHATGKYKVTWSVYSGQDADYHSAFIAVPAGHAKPMSAYELGQWLGRNPDKVVITVFGKAELGPRALGHRSMLASPCNEEMKGFLNMLKKREDWRPVAPICIESVAHIWFEPGTPDPHMLFEHRARNRTRFVAPAIVHLDGTARLQTIDPAQCGDVYDIVKGHHYTTGVPIICNTSANYNGSGFFPTLEDAYHWAADLDLTSNQLARIAFWNGTTLFANERIA